MRISQIFEAGQQVTANVEAAKVRTTLLAMSGVVKRGNISWINDDAHGGSYIISGNEPDIAQIRALIKQIRKKSRLYVVNGLCKMKVYDQPRTMPNTSGFQRPAP